MKERYDDVVYKHTTCYFLSSIHTTIKCMSIATTSVRNPYFDMYDHVMSGVAGGVFLNIKKKVIVLCFFVTSICTAKKWRGYRSILFTSTFYLHLVHGNPLVYLEVGYILGFLACSVR